MKIPINPGKGVRLSLKPGDRLKITTPRGGQVVDLTFLNFSQSMTRNYNSSLRLERGMSLYNKNLEQTLILIEKNSSANIDIIYPGCSKEIYKDRRLGCRDILSNVLQVETSSLPDVVSIFMDVNIEKDGRISIIPSSAKENDYVIFECLKEVVIGISCCPDNINACPNPSKIILEKL